MADSSSSAVDDDKKASGDRSVLLFSTASKIPSSGGLRRAGHWGYLHHLRTLAKILLATGMVSLFCATVNGVQSSSSVEGRMWVERTGNSTPDFSLWDRAPDTLDYHSLFRLVEFSGKGGNFLYFIYETPTPNLYRCGLLRAGEEGRRGNGGLVSGYDVYTTGEPMDSNSSFGKNLLIDTLCKKDPLAGRVLRELDIRITDIAVKISPRTLPPELKTNRLGEVLGVDLIVDLHGRTVAAVETMSR
jgi:hypothetical protein